MREQLEQATHALRECMGIIEATASKMEGARDSIVLTEDTPAETAEFFFHTKTLYEQADKMLNRVYHVVDSMNKHLLPELLRQNGLDYIRVPTVARSFSVLTKTSAVFVDKEKGLEWLRSIGQGDIIQPSVNAGTLSALCRNLVLEQGIDPPQDIVKMSAYSAISMTKYTPK